MLPVQTTCDVNIDTITAALKRVLPLYFRGADAATKTFAPLCKVCCNDKARDFALLGRLYTSFSLQVTEKKLANLIRNYVRVLDVFAKIDYEAPEYIICVNVRTLSLTLKRSSAGARENLLHWGCTRLL